MRIPIMMVALVAIVFSVAFTTKPSSLTWETDYAAAIAKAKSENKTLLLNFTGSDWCGWCKKLDREVFSQDSFVKYADKNLVCVKVDFPRYSAIAEAVKQQNNKLATKHNVRGFPTILVMDATEKVLLQTGYKAGGPSTYIAHLKPYVGSGN